MKDIAMTKFERALEKLNDKQRNAVFSTEGPVMVLAGPGTGKTEILAVRIGNILKEMDVNPYNILCLTYSNAAVEAMRNRLTELIGETSEKISIYTFHSFCKKLLDENAANVFEGKSLISDAQRYMIIEKLIYDHLSIEDPKYLKPAFSFGIDNYVKIFNAVRQENLDQRGVLEIANKCITEVLPYEDKYLLKSGKGLKKTGIELQEKINRFANVIALMFDEYEKELEKRNKYEFEHMLNEAVILLGNNKDLLERLKINYQYILVDEFQDTNLKQVALLNILTENVEQPNVFVVGDDDQCIYRFQGASKQNFDWMRNRFNGDLKTITLDLNYRSTPVILQEAFGLIKQNTERQPEKIHPLISGNDRFANGNHPVPKIKIFETDEHEAYHIASEINQAIQHGANPGDFAILGKRHSDYALIGNWLSHFNIETQINKSWTDLLATPFGRSAFNLLQFIRCREGNIYLAEGFLMQALLVKDYNHKIITSFLKSKKERQSDFYSYLKAYSTDTSITEFIGSLDILLQGKNQEINDEILESLKQVCSQNLNEPSTQEQLDVWQEFTNTFQQTNRIKTILGLADLIWYHDQNQLPIKIEEKKEKKSKAVTLSTIHGSKGLEYEQVYLIGTHDKLWENKSDQGKIKVPDLLNRFIVPEADSDDDLRRLLYVACTRAKVNLTVSSYKSFGTKTSELTALISSYKNSSNVIYEEVSDFDIPSLNEETYQLETNPELLELIRGKVNTFEISPSSLGTWERCQNEFLYNAILKVPGTSAEVPAFGILFHEAMKEIASDISIQYDKHKISALIELLMEKFKYNFHSTHIEKFKAYGKFLVEDYVKRFPLTSKPNKIEETFHALIGENIKIKGQLDRVEIIGSSVKVIDYKTGRSKGPLKPYLNEEDQGSQYWRQAMIYSMLMLSNFRDAYGVQFEFHYPEVENAISSFQYEENAAFLDFLKGIWDNIQTLQFKKFCGNEHCIYCKMDLSKA